MTSHTPLPAVFLARHGETAWSLSGQHTGRTDLPLTARGEDNARRLGHRLAGRPFARVFTSPLQRARTTCERAGYMPVAVVDPDLLEWDYGDYEGKTRVEILGVNPHWNLFRDGCPGGESPAQITVRADRFIHRLRADPTDALVFSSGHFLRVLAARWIGLSCDLLSPHLQLDTASLSILGYDRALTQPVIRLWNDHQPETA